MSALNNAAAGNGFEANMLLMSATFDTSHSPIGPTRLSEQSPSGVRLRHASTALLSSDLDCGTNARVVFVNCGKGH